MGTREVVTTILLLERRLASLRAQAVEIQLFTTVADQDDQVSQEVQEAASGWWSSLRAFHVEALALLHDDDARSMERILDRSDRSDLKSISPSKANISFRTDSVVVALSNARQVLKRALQ
ncbi:hypothetical protein CYMTET_9401, partial [Cymbomonas tetramitiformis]